MFGQKQGKSNEKRKWKERKKENNKKKIFKIFKPKLKFSWLVSHQSELGTGQSLQNLINNPIRQEGCKTQLHLADT